MSSNEDPDQDQEQLKSILNRIKPWNIRKTNVHTGTSKRVYVKRNTNIEPKGPWAYLTSRFQRMNKPTSLVLEHNYTLFLTKKFPGLIVPEFSINEENKPLTDILNSKRGLLITKKHIVRSIGPRNEPPYDTEHLLKFMMNSTDELIDKGFANLDLKAPNIGITDEGFSINDNGSNMFYPIPDNRKEYYRDATKLVGLCNLVHSHGLNKTMFDANRDLYPNIGFERAIELFNFELEQKDKDEIIEYAKEKMSSVIVDEETKDLSPLFDEILFPDQLVGYYGTYGTYKLYDFTTRLRSMGLISASEKEIERKKKENNNLKRELQNMGTENNNTRKRRRMNRNSNRSKSEREQMGTENRKTKRMLKTKLGYTV